MERKTGEKMAEKLAVLVLIDVSAGERDYFRKRLASLEDVELAFKHELLAGEGGRKTYLTALARADVLVSLTFGPEEAEHAKRARWFQTVAAGLPGPSFRHLADRPDITILNSHANAPAVAEHAFAMLLALIKRICQGDVRMRGGTWGPQMSNFSSDMLDGKVCGILGLGAIGKRIAMGARGFGMDVWGIKATPIEDPGARRAFMAEHGLAHLGTTGDLDHVLSGADYIFVALPYTKATRGLLGRRELALMKPGAYMVNVARGPIIDEKALYRALSKHNIKGAAIDTWYNYSKEGWPADDIPFADLPFHELDNVLLSPHRAYQSSERTSRHWDDVARNIERLAAGDEPENVFRMARGY